MGSHKQKRGLPLGFVLVAAALALACIGYAFFRPQQLLAEETSVQRTELLMDTVVDVRVDAPRAAQLVDRVFRSMMALEQELSRFIETSDVSRVNAAAGEWVEVGPAALELVEMGLAIGELSHGAFDVTIGAVMDLWGFGSDVRQIPADAHLAAALETVDYRLVELDREKGRLRIPIGTVLDLGGIAKGYVVQKGIEILREAQVSRAIINAGGDIAVVGKRPDGLPWRVGVQDPLQPAHLRWILPLDDRCVVTSGDYQRYFIQDGERWHHILDPKSGYPARGLRSVTVMGDDIAACDAISTAIFVLGPEKGRDLALELEGFEAILVGDQEEWVSPGLRDKLISQ